MKLTIVYDNETTRPELRADWGFSCLIETPDLNLLFDTGANGDILLYNKACWKITLELYPLKTFK